jgi:hypothetical protein
MKRIEPNWLTAMIHQPRSRVAPDSPEVTGDPGHRQVAGDEEENAADHVG